MRLAVHVRGRGRPLVLLHGFTGSAAAWRVGPEALPGWRRIALDLPGHGDSPPPAVGRETFAELVDALGATLNSLGIESAAWLGYSLGGRVALHVALERPERVAALIVESASPGLADPGARARRLAADEALAASIERAGLDAFVERWLAQPLFASQRALPSAIRAEERERRLAGSAGGFAAALRAFGLGRQADLAPRLAGLACPALFLAGALDVKYAGLARDMAAAAPRGRACVVPGAGHTVHLERSDAFWREVRSFLASSGVEPPSPRAGGEGGGSGRREDPAPGGAEQERRPG